VRRKVEEPPIECPPMATFSDITFQLLIFFLLTIKFKQEEGNLLSLLPKHKGPVSTPVVEIEQEVRIFICADNVKNRTDQHMGARETHQQDVTKLRDAGHPVGEVCRAWVELRRDELSDLFKTERYPSKATANKRVYERVAEQAKSLREKLMAANFGKPVPIIIDSDGLVPWEHPFGLLNALQKRGVFEVEWAANVRFDRYYDK